jgi:hypothetical protein
MYSDEDLDTAVTAGIFTSEAVSVFRRHVSAIRNTSAVDEEHFRLVSSFNDIFVVIACTLLLVSVGGIAGALHPVLGGAAVAGTAWLLAEYFTRKRRMALPSIVLLLAFTGSIAMVGITLNVIFGPRGNEPNFLWPGVIAAVTAFAAWCHWRRFQVPVTVAAASAAVACSIVALVFMIFPGAVHHIPLLSLAAGVAIFLLAMYWDRMDKARLTRKSDVAFWLHLLAAPLLVHPVFASLGVFEQRSALLTAVAILALYVAIAIVSLALDRRALMVSALAYVLYTFSVLLKQFGIVSLGFAVTAMVIGAALLLLSAFWHASRRFVLQRLPRSAQTYLPPGA